MDCPSCAHENPEDARFCGECAASLARDVECPSCGHPNPAGQKFCHGCASPLTAPATPAPPARHPGAYTPRHLADKILRSKSALEGERKQVTVLFADVKGSMELAERLDPEEWHSIMDRFLQILSEGVHRFEGTVNQYTGDGIMALFGAPIAHEDHAQRACYAALRLGDELRSYAQELRRERGLDFAARMGLNSGEVVVGKIGDDLRMDYTAQGHTVGLAARMEQLAEVGRVYLSEQTAALVSGYFELEDLGHFNVKGMTDPVGVSALLGVGQVRTRLDMSRARGFSKFVGRAAETESLEAALEQAQAGRGQVVGVVAEAGTGKSRLCLEFVERCRERGVRVNEAHCPAHGKTVPYLPLLQLLRSIFGIGDRDSDHEARRKIAGELLLLDEKFQELLPLIFDFLGVSDPERPAPAMSPEGRQRQLFAFIRHLTQARSEQEPTVIYLDDLHWIDPGTDAFLAHGVEAVQGTRTLFLVNFRPEYHAEWMSKSYYRQLPLLPLGREAIEELLADQLGGHASVAALPAKIHERTGGNPFFIEEVVQSLVENESLQGAKGAYRLVSDVEDLQIPGTVQSVLAARIDRLAEREKRLLQTASVIDKEFSESILARVAELQNTDLVESLGSLVLAEFLLEKALYPEPEYGFKHPLTQEVAYTSQLADRRSALHGAVARAIEEVDAERLDERAALIAYHWEAADDRLAAARWYARAARWSGTDSPADALRNWEKVWSLLPRPPESDEATSLLLEAGPELLTIGFRQGLSIEAAAEIFEEGREWAAQRGDARAQIKLLYGFGCAYLLGGDPRGALAPFNESLGLADKDGDTELRWAGREPLTAAYQWLGELDRALELNDEMLELIHPDPTIGEVINLSGGFTYGNRGWALCDLGRFEEAADAFRRGVELLQRVDKTELVSFTQAFQTRMLTRKGDAAGALAVGHRAVESAEETGGFLGLVNAYAHQGMALALHGDWNAARDRLELALKIARENRVWLSIEADFVAELAEVYLALGDGERARTTAEDAVQIALRTDTPLFELRAHLAVARIRRALDGAAARDEIEAALRRSTSIVENTGARSYQPFIHEERAQLARVLGDDASYQRELEAALRAFGELGATGHSERLGALAGLGPTPSSTIPPERH
jgi:class 3 adenylate cyclase/tetratricopeptide (TPR) repeat protein